MAVHVGHSTGGGEVARYMGRHGTKRPWAKACANRRHIYRPLDAEELPAIPAACRSASSMASEPGVLAGPFRSSLRILALPFYGYNRPGVKALGGEWRESFWLQGMMAGIPCGLLLHQGVFRNGSKPKTLQRMDIPNADHSR